MIDEELAKVRADIEERAVACGREAGEIVLVGVTKYADAADIQKALDAGLTDIGENKVQAAREKFQDLKSPTGDFRRHMIGHLQTNKVKHALELFDLIQSVDSRKLAAEISKQAEKKGRDGNILVQVNTSGEEQKYGCRPEDAGDLIEEISNLPRIHVLGLMTIAPYTDDKDAVRAAFRRLSELFLEFTDRFQGKENVQMRHLSMGMTDDYDIAIEEGANMVRIGRAIFKNQKDRN